MEHVETFLRKLPLFKNFFSMELNELIEKSQLKTFAPHAVIINFGQPGRFLGIVLAGIQDRIKRTYLCNAFYTVLN